VAQRKRGKRKVQKPKCKNLNSPRQFIQAAKTKDKGDQWVKIIPFFIDEDSKLWVLGER